MAGEVIDDLALYRRLVALVESNPEISLSAIQLDLRIGFVQAGRLKRRLVLSGRLQRKRR